MLTPPTKLTALLVVAVLVSGCAAGRAFRRGEQRAAGGDWDTAVAYLREAVRQAPQRADYGIALQRAMLSASREHITAARDLEAKDQLDAALIEWKKASEFDPANRQAAAKSRSWIAALANPSRRRGRDRRSSDCGSKHARPWQSRT